MTSSIAQGGPDEGRSSATQEQVDGITSECGVPSGWLRLYSETEVGLHIDPDAEYELVDKVLTKLKSDLPKVRLLGFVGNEIDPDVVLTFPYEYISGGSLDDLQRFRNEAEEAGWAVVRLAIANDGFGYLVIRTAEGMTHRDAEPLLDRMWGSEFEMLEFGRPPTKRSEDGY